LGDQNFPAGNRVAHTPPRVTVTLAAADEDAAIRIEVSDSGLGIPADEKQARLLRGCGDFPDYQTLMNNVLRAFVQSR
jgi:anti-sigma regulatory factor (Ser/Thr protein kinase)